MPSLCDFPNDPRYTETMLNGEPNIRDDAAELLAWYAEMGVDIALADEPQDRFAEAPPHGRIREHHVRAPPARHRQADPNETDYVPSVRGGTHEIAGRRGGGRPGGSAEREDAR